MAHNGAARALEQQSSHAVARAFQHSAPRAMRVAEGEGLTWSASPWDLESVAVVGSLDVEWVKVASASITDEPLVRACGDLGVPVIMSTGMSTTAEIDAAVEWVCSTRCPGLALLHTCSAYPSAVEDLHLGRIAWLRERYQCVVGYSGHESGVLPSVEAVRLGASIVERHVTLDRTMWGSDQAASLEPAGLRVMVRAIREVEAIRAAGHADEHTASDAVAIAEVAEVMRKNARNPFVQLEQLARKPLPFDDLFQLAQKVLCRYHLFIQIVPKKGSAAGLYKTWLFHIALLWVVCVIVLRIFPKVDSGLVFQHSLLMRVLKKANG